ncbi:uncharacterized protein PHACADRAFT_206512 [Phanerochaete carnosa HHB-10118-sp]|uniref:DUF4470 domain-containing protein n=1 Tax=Phanerochaete carnosa (strain HHB-10118-sp) TaxID=650164 RepID=K5V4R6_PHACS|nr:uncharacterized protein PHACADRAFT_206512 [Phanerochaete carnosa HHB-10118-sp]EKM57621.1 hypothetical protein PHACADRAFT_206512 [Phanerochaete carnosa HHB-10118-sp]
MSHPIRWQRAYDFHPIGHTPPTSLVRDIPPEKDANILILQCSDPHYIFYTLYSSGSDDSLSTRKLDFTRSNDEPAILARNILLYTLILRDDFDSKKHLIWNIFYHLLLDDASLSLLIEQCRNISLLSRQTEAWDTGKYAEFIKIGTQLTLQELHHHWSWYARTGTFNDTHKTRLKDKLLRYQKKHQKYYRGFVNTFPARATGPMWMDAGVIMNEAYHRYWETGTTYTREYDIQNAVYVNPLFAYSNSQQTFATNDFTAPLATFLMADAFCSLHPADSSTWPKPTVDDLHAVARSQFYTWCLCFRSCVQSRKVILRHIYSDPLALGLTLQEYARSKRTSIACRVKPWRAAFLVLDGDGFCADTSKPSALLYFDVIDTANLSDTQGILNVLVACIPVLKTTAWATLYTETQDVYGDDPVTDSLVQLCGDLGTMSLFLDLAPISYLSKFRSEANIEELTSRQLILSVKGFVERLTWRRPSCLETNDRTLVVTAPQMEDFLYNLCLQMFQREAVSPDDETEGSEHERSRAHYCRRSFALLVRHLASRVSTDWAAVVENLGDRMNMSYDLMIARVSLFDYACQFYQTGVHSELHYRLGNVMHLESRLYSRLREWRDIPPVVWLAFPVPRATLRVLDEKDAPHNPPISVGVGSEVSDESYHFPSFEPFFGSLTIESHADRARAYITEDTQGRRGDSPLIVTFCMPTHLLARPAGMEMSVRLLVLKTPETTKFYAKYGNVGRFFELSTTDPRVHVLTQPPTLRRDAKVEPLINSPIFRAVSVPDSVHIGFDNKKEKVATMTVRTTFEDPEIKAALTDKVATPVDFEHTCYCVVRVKLGSRFHRDVLFPYPIDGTKVRIRLSRRESWVEAIAVPSPLGKSSVELPKHCFPMIADASGSVPWNLHRILLGRLPQLSTKSVNMLRWVHRHVDFAFSRQENQARSDPLANKDTLTLIKSTISSIFKNFLGSRDTPGRSTIMLARQDGSLDFMLFVAGLRLDAAAHTVVLDSFIPHASTDALRRLTNSLCSKAARITLFNEESRVWRRLLLVLAERCREWRHAPECRYLSTTAGEAPLPLDEWPLCECGQGRDIDALRRKKDWAPFAPYTTRVAVSQLFAVSYLEVMCGNVLHDKMIIFDEHNVPVGNMRLLLDEGGRDGKDDWDTYCLIIYEFLITVNDEINIVWKRSITVSAVLLGSVRCCLPLNIVNWIIFLTGFVQISLFSALRVFAIWNRSYIWSLVVFALSMAPFVTNLIEATVSKYSSTTEPFFGVVCIQKTPFSVQKTIVYITRSSPLVADTVVLILTWIKTFGHWRSARSVNIRVPLTTCLLRDGTLYFMSLLAINIAQLLTYNFPAGTSAVSAFITILPLLLVNRFMINLRTVNSEAPDYSLCVGDQQQGPPTLQVRGPVNRLGNIGGTLQDGLEDEPWVQEDSSAGVDEVGPRQTSAEA